MYDQTTKLKSKAQLAVFSFYMCHMQGNTTPSTRDIALLMLEAEGYTLDEFEALKPNAQQGLIEKIGKYVRAVYRRKKIIVSYPDKRNIWILRAELTDKQQYHLIRDIEMNVYYHEQGALKTTSLVNQDRNEKGEPRIESMLKQNLAQVKKWRQVEAMRKELEKLESELR